MVLTGSAYLGAVLTTDHVGSKAVFLPGVTSDGHYQIEIACNSCHTPLKGVTNDACQRCHGDELTAVNDSHPRSKFTDPRNAELVTQLDATRCVTCHREHRPDMTRAMGVTQPDDFCFMCHRDVGKDRPSHTGLGFETCGSAGCHNYHDNTALYEDFLVAHAGEPAVRPQPRVSARRRDNAPRPDGPAGLVVNMSLRNDAPQAVKIDARVMAEWESTTHARAGVNCTGCHSGAAGSPSPGTWKKRPDEQACAVCHQNQVDGFLGGRHGMRPARGLAPMTPAMARRPMKAAAADRRLSCSSCHSAHAFDTRHAAVDACLSCHDDGHSRAYRGSAHHQLWAREVDGSAPTGTGVSCATCHLPRLAQRSATSPMVIQHNQNSNLRPNEKMTRTVCLACHGLGFSLDALADPRLIASNFTGRPTRHIASIDMATRRVDPEAVRSRSTMEGER